MLRTPQYSVVITLPGEVKAGLTRVRSSRVMPMMRLDSANLAPYDNYQVQFKPALGGGWGNWNGGLFNPAGVANSQYLLVTNGAGFFRLQYVP